MSHLLARRLAVALCACAGNVAPAPALADTFRFVPAVALRETYSDNVDLLPQDAAHAGWRTEIVPSVHAELHGPRISGILDYRVVRTEPSDASGVPATRRALNAFVNAQPLENRLVLDARAALLPQSRSAFEAQAAPDLSHPDRNTVQTTSYQLSPLLRGSMGTAAAYQVRVIESHLKTDDPTMPAVRTTEWIGKAATANAGAALGWSVEAFATQVREEGVPERIDQRVRASLVFEPWPDLHASILAGHERTDFTGSGMQSQGTAGAALDWTPGPRTHVAALYEERFFGSSHRLLFAHRTPRTAWRVLSLRDATVLPAQLATARLTSIESVASDLLASSIPDPAQRAEAVRRRFEDSGIASLSPLDTRVYTTSAFLYHADVASVAIFGTRTTFTASIARREQRAFVETPGVEDFRQRGFDMSLARRLTPFTTLTFNGTWLQTQGLGATPRQSGQRVLSLFVLSMLSPRTAFTLGLRRASFESATGLDSYRENMVFATISTHL